MTIYNTYINPQTPATIKKTYDSLQQSLQRPATYNNLDPQQFATTTTVYESQQQTNNDLQQSTTAHNDLRKLYTVYKAAFELAARYSQFANANLIFANAEKSILRMVY